MQVLYWFFLIWGVCKRETSASIDTYNSDEVSCFILPYNRERTKLDTVVF